MSFLDQLSTHAGPLTGKKLMLIDEAGGSEKLADPSEVFDSDFGPSQTPILSSRKSSPFRDADAAAVITATSTTDERGIAHYELIVAGLKDIGVWSRLENGFLFGDLHQSSSATLQSLTGANTATGTGTNNDASVTLNGSTDGYSVTNANQTAAATGRCFVGVVKHDGVTQPGTIISGYAGGTSKGPLLSIAGSTISGAAAGNLDDLYGYWSADGSANSVTDTVQDVNDADWTFAAMSLNAGETILMGNSRAIVTSTLATAWVNGTTWAIGKNVPGAQDLAGEMAAALIFSDGLTAEELFNVRLLLESVLADEIDFPPCIVWEGNSLTAGTSGGGTSVVNQVMALSSPAWDTIRTETFAAPGDWLTRQTLPRYRSEVRRWVGANYGKRILYSWCGVNDITGGASSKQIIEAYRQFLIGAKEDGFFVVILPLTPVGPTGTGYSYQYDNAKQTILAEVNTWLESEGSRIADQFLDIRKIGETNPEFLDPEDSTYYVASDGLHHNDAGRTLIANYISANLDLPTS